jgi:uncharacterized protein YwgA
MKIYEIILLMISELGGILAGRTKIQKLCYFYSLIANKEFGFRPHYYGPYSPMVENTLDELEGIGLIDKRVERLGENFDGFEVKRYDYGITIYGQQVVETIVDSHEKRQLKEFIRKVIKIGLPNTTDISIAAKAYYILQRESMPLTDDEIQKKAKAFGWDINSNSINSASNFLKAFNLITVNQHA